MKLTYGNGEVLFDGSAQGFQLRYKGSITITESPDNLFLSANETKIIGVMLEGTDMPQKLFNYIGSLEITSANFVNWDEESYVASIITLDKSTWTKSDGKWSSDDRKPEEVDNNKVIHKKIYKSKI